MERRLAAILAADMAGYSRLMEADEAGTLAALKALRGELIEPEIARRNGRIVKTTGDGLLAEFASVVDAVAGAVAIQREMAARHEGVPRDRRIDFRIGVNLGDIIIDGDDIYGDGVNVAARLEGLAEPGGICISGTAYDQLKAKVDVGYEDLGERRVKNIAQPVRVYRVRLDAQAGGRVTVAAGTRLRRWKWLAAAAGGALVALLAAGYFGIFPIRAPGPDVEPASVERMAFPLPDKPSIAVLPFDDFSGHAKQEHLADALSENIITALSRIPQLFVIARNSTFTYKGKPVLARTVAEEQGVRYVLEGSIQRSDDRIRVNVQLIDALAGHHIWAERYDRAFENIFDLQDDIARQVATALQIKLTTGFEVQSYGKGTKNLEAFLLAHEAVYLHRKLNREDEAKAHELIRQARAIAPDYLFALQMEAWIHLAEARFGWSESRQGSIREAEKLAQQAVEIDRENASTYFLLAGIHRARRELDKAIGFMEKTVELNPNHAAAWGTMAQILNYAGRPHEAISAVRTAMRLAPYYPAFFQANLGLSYMMIGEYDKAITAYQEVLRRKALVLFSHERLTAIYALKADMAKAREHADKVLELKPNFNVREWSKALPYKNREDLDRELSALLKAGLPESPPLKLPDKPSIAVLPFANMSGDPEQEYFADGMTDDLITDLSKISGLFVIARNSSFRYKGKSPDIRAVGRELGVRYVLDGSVRRAGEVVRINAQLVDTKTGGQVWAARYDGRYAETFALQDKVTGRIIEALALSLNADERARLADKGTDNFEAHDAYLRGQSHARRFTAEGFDMAIAEYKRALELDANYNRAAEAIAHARYMRKHSGLR